jgi:hypothetical protein
MRPAEGKLDVAALGQRAIAGIAVNLQHACEAGEVRGRSLGLSVRRVEIDDAGRISAAPWPIVARVGP